MRDGSISMLLTSPESELAIPAELHGSAGQFWRAAEALGAGFFIALMTSESFERREPRTLVLTWDSDVVHFIESPRMRARFLTLHHFKARRDAGPPSNLLREIREIWKAIDSDSPDSEVIVFKATDGSSFCGAEAIPVPGSIRLTALICTIRDGV